MPKRNEKSSRNLNQHEGWVAAMCIFWPLPLKTRSMCPNVLKPD